jgi:hypothetical protein
MKALQTGSLDVLALLVEMGLLNVDSLNLEEVRVRYDVDLHRFGSKTFARRDITIYKRIRLAAAVMASGDWIGVPFRCFFFVHSRIGTPRGKLNQAWMTPLTSTESFATGDIRNVQSLLRMPSISDAIGFGMQAFRTHQEITFFISCVSIDCDFLIRIGNGGGTLSPRHITEQLEVTQCYSPTSPMQS